jgi:hypothetical protein
MRPASCETTAVEIVVMEMLIEELHDKVCIEHTYPRFLVLFPYEKVVLKMKDMPIPRRDFGRSRRRLSYSYEMFIRQDDHALVLVLLAQGLSSSIR